MTIAEIEATFRELVKELPGSQTYYTVMLDAMFLHPKKNADYTGGDSATPFANFIEAAMESDSSPESVFDMFLGTKRSRRRSLRRTKASPKNESLRDTSVDEINYTALRQAMHEDHPEIFDKVLHITAEHVL